MTDDVRDEGRRGLLKLAAGAAAGAGALPPAIAQALALPASGKTGTIQDVEHVVILMQENRSFDHYFGTLRGVRGFGDPRPIKLPSGRSVWEQPTKDGRGVVGPFRLNAEATAAENLFSLDHSWKGSHAKWKRHDAWIAAKSPLTMGYFTRSDVPYYYALADAFTVCDANYCSIFGPTNPNRLFLFSGTSGLAAGDDSKIVIENPDHLEPNENADPLKDSKWPGLAWPTYAERLQKAGVSWKLYQEYDNYGDNALAFFAGFRGVGPDSELYQRGRAWSPGSNAANAKTADGEHLVAQFAADVNAGTLPQVSWIVAPYLLCEHPQASPSAGEHLTARLIGALADKPEVWAKTVFILNYDENDGFFDHMPPPIPATGPALGKSTVEATAEVYHGEPVGFGPRVPMIVVSPWTKGGYVNSQVFDHTSVLRFLETRFGVEEPHISPWRRAVSGDLTSVFDFKGAGRRPVGPLPDSSALVARAEKARKLGWPKIPGTSESMPRQEAGVRPARALPYAFEVASTAKADTVRLTIANTGAAGAAFNLYPAGAGEPRFYTVEAGKSVDDDLPIDGGGYHVELHGPNGFLRTLRGPAGKVGPEARARFDAKSGRLEIALHNDGPAPATFELAMEDYLHAKPRRRVVGAGAEVVETIDLRPSRHWYDVSVTCAQVPGFERRFAGHGEDGRPSISDPALGRQA
jgi:phospholipase C